MQKRSKPFTFSPPDLVKLYSKPHTAENAQWRAISAVDKAVHIQELTKNLPSRIESVLEVGCGTGAVLQELAARRVGSIYTGIEIGTERSKPSDELKGKSEITISGYDGKKIPFEDQSFDLVFATHVLEHVTNDRAFLLELRRVARHYVYVEVPCELHLRTSYRSIQKALANLGHINHYTFRSFALKLETSGLSVVGLEVFDHSYEVHRHSSNWFKTVAKMAIRRSLLGLSRDLASQMFTYHVGAICKRSTPLTID